MLAQQFQEIPVVQVAVQVLLQQVHFVSRKLIKLFEHDGATESAAVVMRKGNREAEQALAQAISKDIMHKSAYTRSRDEFTFTAQMTNVKTPSFPFAPSSAHCRWTPIPEMRDNQHSLSRRMPWK